jgi:hypothetical protein
VLHERNTGSVRLPEASGEQEEQQGTDSYATQEKASARGRNVTGLKHYTPATGKKAEFLRANLVSGENSKPASCTPGNLIHNWHRSGSAEHHCAR